jgi:hypothetical protein
MHMAGRPVRRPGTLLISVVQHATIPSLTSGFLKHWSLASFKVKAATVEAASAARKRVEMMCMFVVRGGCLCEGMGGGKLGREKLWVRQVVDVESLASGQPCNIQNTCALCQPTAGLEVSLEDHKSLGVMRRDAAPVK